LEAEATRYASLHCPSIPIPRVHDFWVESDTSARLVMDFVEGERLQTGWKRITEAQKLNLMRILRLHIKEMRSVPQPNGSGWIGSVSGGPCYDVCAFGDKLYGPFPNEPAYNDWRISTFSSFGDIHAPTAARLKELRAEMPDSHRITFTHGDLTDRNILIRISGDGPDDVSVAAIIDWAQAGWRPEYWEKMKYLYNSGESWRQMADQMLFPGHKAEIDRELELLSIQGAPR
ncbi:hypothetical protein C8R47DRAFT_1170049, partial [Mycena vitilis]